MMYSGITWGNGMWMALGALNCFFGLLVFLGIVGLVIWMWKHAKKEQVKKFVIWSLAIGIIGGALTAPFVYNGWNMKNKSKSYYKMMWMNGGADEWMEKMEEEMEEQGMMRGDEEEQAEEGAEG